MVYAQPGVGVGSGDPTLITWVPWRSTFSMILRIGSSSPGSVSLRTIGASESDSLVAQEPALGVDLLPGGTVAGVAADAVGGDHAVAGDDDGDAVVPVRLPDRLRTLRNPDLRGD